MEVVESNRKKAVVRARSVTIHVHQALKQAQGQFIFENTLQLMKMVKYGRQKEMSSFVTHII